MEDLFGFVIFVIFLLFSIGGRVMKGREPRGRETRQPPYPGPVAGPGVPGFPRPQWPEGPRPQQPARPKLDPQPAPRRQPEPEYGSLGGHGSMGPQGLGSGMEGPGSATTEEQIDRFNRETDRFTAQMQRDAERLGSLGRAEAATVDRAEGVRVDLAGALTDRQGMAKAIVLAEVLGEPKGLRRFPQRKR